MYGKVVTEGEGTASKRSGISGFRRRVGNSHIRISTRQKPGTIRSGCRHSSNTNTTEYTRREWHNHSPCRKTLNNDRFSHLRQPIVVQTMRVRRALHRRWSGTPRVHVAKRVRSGKRRNGRQRAVGESSRRIRMTGILKGNGQQGGSDNARSNN